MTAFLYAGILGFEPTLVYLLGTAVLLALRHARKHPTAVI